MAEKTPEQLLADLRTSEKNLSVQLETKKTLEEKRDLEEKILKTREEQFRILYETGEISREIYKQALDAAEEIRQKRRDQLETEKKVLEAQEEINKELEKQLELALRQGKAVENIFNKWRGGVLESVFETGIQLKDIGRSLKENITLTNLGGMAASTMLQSTAAAVTMLDSAMGDLAKATGTGREYQDVVMDASKGAAALGVGIQQSAQALQGLHSGMSSFRALNESTQASIARTVGSLVALGVSAEDAAFSVDFAMRTMGMGAIEAAQLTDDVGKFAMEIGKSPAQTISDLKSSMPQLAAYGKNAMSVFKGLQAQSRKLGIEMNTLLGITQQFDTFEGAAEAAGKLNALLGGPFLDTMELLSAETEEQRVQLVQSALVMSGQSFDSMSKFQKMSIAASVGIADMTVANNMFSESSKAAAEQTQFGTMTLDEYNKKKEESQTITEKLTQLVQQFAVAVSPIVTAMNWVITAILEVNDATGGILLPVLGGALVVLGLLSASVVTLAPALSLFAPAATAAGAAAPALGAGLTSLTPAIPVILTLAATMLAFGASVWMIGTAIQAAAPALAMLSTQFFSAMGTFLPILSENLPAFMTLPFTIGGLAASLAGLAIVGLPGMLILLGLSSAFSSIAESGFLSSMETFLPALSANLSALQALPSVFSDLALSLAAFATFGGVGVLVFNSLIGSITSVAQELTKLTEQDALVKFVNVVGEIEDGDIDRLEGLVDQADRYVKVQAVFSAAQAAMTIADSLGKLLFSNKGKEGAEAGGPNQKNVILQLDDREFARAVVNVLDNKIKLNTL